MKVARSLILSLALLSGLLVVNAASAHEEHKKDAKADPVKTEMKGELIKVTDKAAAWFAKAKADYPTNVCVVSGDKLGGDMGLPKDYIYRVAGKPDRLVRFCCGDCVKEFKDHPAKSLAAIDAAAAKKAAK